MMVNVCPLNVARRRATPVPVRLYETHTQARIRQISDRLMDVLMAAADLSEIAPIRLEGGAEFDLLYIDCPECRLMCELIRGEVRQPFPWLIEIEGHGYCIHCREMTEFFCRVRQRSGELEPRQTWMLEGGWYTAKASELTPSLLTVLWQELRLKLRWGLQWLRSRDHRGER